MTSRITNRIDQHRQLRSFTRGRAAGAALGAALCFFWAPTRLLAQTPAAPKPAIAMQAVSPALSFEKTPGLPEAQFTARTRRGSLVLERSSAVLSMGRRSPGERAGQLQLKFAGANKKSAISGEEELPGKIYHASGDLLGPLNGNPTFRRVRYSQLYPGIDAVFYGNERELEFDFQVAPHGDPSQIRLSVSGANKIALEPTGDLALPAGDEQVHLKKPIIYQQRNGIRTEVAGAYKLSNHGSEARFEVGSYDKNLPLIIDPSIVFATYFGSAGDEFVTQVRVNAAGEIYLFGGSTQSSALPPHQTFPLDSVTLPTGYQECFLTKLSNDGSTALYTVVFGGVRCNSNSGGGPWEAVELSNGKVHLAVIPSFAGALLRTLTESTMSLDLLQGAYDFPTGHILEGLRADPWGNIYLAVSTFDQSVSHKLFQLWKVDADGQLVGQFQLFASPLNSSHQPLAAISPSGLDVDDVGNAYVLGDTLVDGVITPTANAFQSGRSDTPQCLYGAGKCHDGFLLRVNTSNANAFQIDYATYIGGNQDDILSGVVFDASSNTIVVSGSSFSTNFPTTAGSFAPTFTNPNGLFPQIYEPVLVKLDLSQQPAQQLIYGTFLGGSAGTNGQIRILPGGFPVIAGFASDSPTGPSLPPEIQLVNSFYPAYRLGSSRPWLSILSPDAKSLVFSTYLDSGPNSQSNYDPEIATNGTRLYVALASSESGLGIGNNVFQQSKSGGYDVLLRELNVSDLPSFPTGADLYVVATAAPNSLNVGDTLNYSAVVRNLGPQLANNASLNVSSPNLNFQNATSSQGICSMPTANSVTCLIGTMPVGDVVNLNISAIPQLSGPAITTFSIGSSAPDPNNSNNHWQLTTTVNGGQPTLTTVDPKTGQQGQTGLSVNLTGQLTHWVQGTTTVSFGAGITVKSLNVNSATTATAVIDIAPAATIGARDVTVTTGTEVVTLSSGFSVTGVAVINVTENITVTDAPNVLPSAMIPVGENITVTDTPNVLPSAMIPVGENIVVTDAPGVVPQQGAFVPIGSGVLVALLDSLGNPLPIQLTFASVIQQGLAKGNPVVLPPLPPPGYKFLGTVFDITTTAVYSGPITVCFLGSGFLPQDQLWHAGALIGNTLNAPTQVCASVNSLSPFGVVRPSYQISLLYDPDVAKKSGSAYPIKVQLTDESRNNLSSASIAVHAVSVTQLSTNAPLLLDDTGNANADFDFRYDSTLNGYIFNLSTTGYASGTYSLNFTAGGDPTVHSAQFAVK